jgi:hypothetical protein
MDNRAVRRAIQTGWALAALLVTGVPLSPDCAAQASHRDPRGQEAVVIGVDALGLIEGWAAAQGGRMARSTAQPPGDLRKLLLSCPRAWALEVTVEDEGASEPGSGAGGEGFRCRPGEALYARPEGLWCGLRPSLPPSVNAGLGPSSLVIVDGPREVLVTGACMRPDGGVEAAVVSADLNGLPPLTGADCADGRSTTTFRGRMTAGGCP